MSKRTGAKLNRRAALLAVVTALWCLLIFCLSAQNADDSSELSGGVIYFFCRLIVSGFTTLGEAAREAMISSLQFWTRKTAHFCVYMVLGALTLQIYLAAKKPQRRPAKYAAAWGLCVFYSVTDEIHQIFVPGRAGQLRDVCIDSAGAAAGLLASALVILLVRRIKAMKSKK